MQSLFGYFTLCVNSCISRLYKFENLPPCRKNNHQFFNEVKSCILFTIFFAKIFVSIIYVHILCCSIFDGYDLNLRCQKILEVSLNSLELIVKWSLFKGSLVMWLGIFPVYSCRPTTLPSFQVNPFLPRILET